MGLSKLHLLFRLLLEMISVAILISLTGVVVYAVAMRWMGHSPAWYDEVAVVLLAWLTYYAGALAALSRSHIGFDGILIALPIPIRFALVVIAEVVVIGFFSLLAYTGFQIVQILDGMTMISLPSVPLQLTQSVIPIGGGLFVLAQLISLPGYLRRLSKGISQDHLEIETA